MSAIFNEYLIFHQENGPNVELIVNGDEFYARYETTDGYSVVYDLNLGLFCYADLLNGSFVSTATPVSKQPPVGLPKHLKESPDVRNSKFQQRYHVLRPPEPPAAAPLRTYGPDKGLLEGRRLSKGQVRGLTILVDFADLQSTVTATDVDKMLNSTGYTANGNFCSVREYFRLLSAGKLDYQNVVMGPVRLSKKQEYYIDNLLVKEALNIIASQLNNDFSQFDSRGEGIIDAVNFMYAGRSEYVGQLWPHNSTIDLQYGNYRTHFYMLTSAGRNSVDLSIGTFCHETGHLLCRWPDLYDYGNRDGDFEASCGIGNYCLMGSGNHLNRGRVPSSVCSYLRDLVGWTDNQVEINTAGNFEAHHGDYGTVFKYVFDDTPNEYFIIENRSQLGLDSYLPSTGLAVYHCDWLGSNEWQGGTPDKHYQCGLLQGDEHLDLELNMNLGDAEDLFANHPGIALADNTTPSTRRWNRSGSGLIIGDISAAGERMNFRVGSVVAGNIARGEVTADMLIPDNLPEGIQSIIVMSESGKLKSIKARVSILHPTIGDLQIELIAPFGKRVMLHDQTGSREADLKHTWDLNSVPTLAEFSNESIQGIWTLALRDLRQGSIGRLNWWGLEIEYGSPDQQTSV